MRRWTQRKVHGLAVHASGGFFHDCYRYFYYHPRPGFAAASGMVKSRFAELLSAHRIGLHRR